MNVLKVMKRHINVDKEYWRVDFKTSTGRGYLESLISTRMTLSFVQSSGHAFEIEAKIPYTDSLNKLSYVWTPMVQDQIISGPIDEDQRLLFLDFMKTFAKESYASQKHLPSRN